MDIARFHRHHRVHFFVKAGLQALTLVTAALAVHELDRIHHVLKKIERKEKRRIL